MERDPPARPSDAAAWLLWAAYGLLVGAPFLYLVTRSWLPTATEAAWRGVAPMILVGVATVFGLASALSGDGAELLRVRRSGLDGGTLQVSSSPRALNLLAAVFFGGLGAWLAMAELQRAEPGSGPPATEAPAATSAAKQP